MFQNRVDPMGNIIMTGARGSWMGNRGLIHNDRRQIVKPFKLQAWITCLLEFKGWHRNVMTPGLYTELFFLDEATAFSAGHRPCAECRRTAFNEFKTTWLKANAIHGFNSKTKIALIDQVLHAERIKAGGDKVTYQEKLGQLPDGTFIQKESLSRLWYHQQLHTWSPFGYGPPQPGNTAGVVTVLTPKSIVQMLDAGYPVQVKL